MNALLMPSGQIVVALVTDSCQLSRMFAANWASAKSSADRANRPHGPGGVT